MNATHSGTDPDHSTSRSGIGTAIGPLTVAEAAALLGVEPRTVIKYREQGKIRGEKHGKAWRLWLAQTFVDTIRAERSGTHSGIDPEWYASRSGTRAEYIDVPLRTTPAEIERAIERTGEKYVTDFAAFYDRISAELSKVYEGQLAAKDETITAKEQVIAAQADTISAQQAAIAELQQQADAVRLREAAAAAVEANRRRLEQERRNRESLEAAQVTQEASGTPETPEEVSQGLWARLGRWWRG